MPSPYFADIFVLGQDKARVDAAARRLWSAIREDLAPEVVKTLRQVSGPTATPTPAHLRGQGLAYDSRALPQRVPGFAKDMRQVSADHPGVRIVVVSANANDPQEVGIAVAQAGRLRHASATTCQAIALDQARARWGQEGERVFDGDNEGTLDPAEVSAAFLEAAWSRPPLSTLHAQPCDGPPPSLAAPSVASRGRRGPAR